MTRMSAPIGNYVGNSLEILESINCLKGKGPSDLQTLVETIGMHISIFLFTCILLTSFNQTTGGNLLEITHKVKSVKEGRKRIIESLNNGTALEKFKEMLIKQKVDENIANELCYGNTTAVLPMAKYKLEIKSPTSGNLLANIRRFHF